MALLWLTLALYISIFKRFRAKGGITLAHLKFKKFTFLVIGIYLTFRWNYKNFGKKIFEFFWKKNFRKKILSLKKKNFFGKKISEKKISENKFLGKKIFFGKNFRKKKISEKKFLGKKNFFGKKKIWEKKTFLGKCFFFKKS